VPSLLRFLTVIAILAGLVYGAMWALATYVQPVEREMTQPVQLSPPKK
jgi:hypothetical protein